MSVQSLFSLVPILHRMIQWMGFIKASGNGIRAHECTHTHTDINPSCPFTRPLSSSYCEVTCVCSCFDTSMGILNAPHLETPVAFWRTKHQRNLYKLSAVYYITIQKCNALKRSSLSVTYIAYPQILWILIYISPNRIS